MIEFDSLNVNEVFKVSEGSYVLIITLNDDVFDFVSGSLGREHIFRRRFSFKVEGMHLGVL